MKTDLIYGVEDRPPFKDALFAALQHLLAIFVAIITPPLIIRECLETGCRKDKLSSFHVPFCFGSIYLYTMPSFRSDRSKAALHPGNQFFFYRSYHRHRNGRRIAVDFRSCMAAAPIEMIVSRTFKYLRNIITPLVSGIVVLLIGLSLIKVGIVSCGGGYAAMDNGTFATWKKPVYCSTGTS